MNVKYKSEYNKKMDVVLSRVNYPILTLVIFKRGEILFRQFNNMLSIMLDFREIYH